MLVIVTDIQFRKAFDVVNIIRSLGYDVVPTRSKPGFWTKAKAFLGIPEKSYLLRFENPEVFVTDYTKLHQILKKRFGEKFSENVVIVGCEEATIEFIAANCGLIQERGIQGFFPGEEAFNIAVDKGALMLFCEEKQIATPKTYSKNCQYIGKIDKWVIKPKRGTGAQGVRYGNEPEELIQQINENEKDNYLIQEFIDSSIGVIGGFFFCENGKVVSSYCHQRIRTYPDSGGVTVYSKVRKDSQMEAFGARLLGELGWSGFAMLECIEDLRNGELKLIEVNPRLWGSVMLSEFSGAALIKNYLLRCEGNDPVTAEEVHDNCHIRWPFPYDFLLWLRQKPKTLTYWRNPNPTCFINWTYCSPFRALCFQVMNLLDPANIAKFIKRLVRIAK